MVSSVSLLLGATAVWVVYAITSGLLSNIAKARKADLPYIVVPIHPHNRLWQLAAWFWIPIFRRCPQSWWDASLFVLEPDWTFHSSLAPFERIGHSFMVCSMGGITLFTMNADAIRQITARREIFPKPLDNYEILAIFGDNVLTTEGVQWRMHRKVTSASFNEKNAAHTFAEAVNQAQSMVESWLGPDGKAKGTITTLGHDTMTLALNIIGYVGFGLRLLWPGQTLPADSDPKLAKYGSLVPPPGHTLSFADALATSLDRLITLLVVPWPLLGKLPFQWAKIAWEAKENLRQYMDEFLQEKIDEVRRGEQEKDGMDIMGQLVRTKYGNPNSNGKSSSSELSDNEIIGNAFIMIIAGHETSGGTLHFVLLELATNPASQRAVHRDVDALFGDSDPATWNYEQTINPLLASHLAASMNETLRLIPPAIEIPKQLPVGRGGHTLSIDGTKHVLPEGLTISLCLVSVHKNPRYWPERPSHVVAGAGDLEDFQPERWYRKADGGGSKEEVEGGDTEDFGGFEGPDTSASLFRPERGAFLPFSEGARSCLGRRIAQVEMLATLAVLFQKYSLELDVSKWASDAEVERMGPEERRTLYKKAQDESRRTIRTASATVTLRLRDGAHVPVRLVRRGEERFLNVVDL